MEKKKAFNLETKRKVYFSLGLFIVSTIVLCAFTYKTPVYIDNTRLAIEHEAEVPLLMVEQEVELEKPELPEVEKIPETKPSTPIFDNEFLNNIKITGNDNSTPTIKLSGNSIPTLTFEPDPGLAPEMERVVKYPKYEAQFIGNWPEYLKKHLVYPSLSREWNESGTVIVSFVVERDGSISNISVLNEDRVSKRLQNEAVRVVKGSPKWKPGINHGEMVRSNMIVHINFVLAG